MSTVEISEEELAALRAQAQGQQVPPAYSRLTSAEREQQDAMLAAVKYSLTGWGPKIHQPFDIQCPSGQTCLAKQIGIEDAISLGMLDSLDMFTNNLMTPIIEGAEDQPEEDANKAILNGLKDPEKRASFFGTVNKVVAWAVMKPEIVLVDDGNMSEGQVFANDIPFADKMHIFRRAFAGGGQTLDTFQQGQEAVLADMAHESVVQGSPE